MRHHTMVLPVLMIGLLTACATPTQGKAAPTPAVQAQQSPEEVLRARATQFWEARVKGDLATQYDLLEPSERQNVTLTGFYRSRSSMVFQSYEIQGVEVDDEVGLVKAKTTFRLNLKEVSRFGPWTQVAFMRWVRVGGLWYLRGDQQDVKQPTRAGDRQP